MRNLQTAGFAALTIGLLAAVYALATNAQQTDQDLRTLASNTNKAVGQVAAGIDQVAIIAAQKSIVKTVEIEERIIHLPEDGQRYYTSVFTSDGYHQQARERELMAWFQSDPRLASLRAQTHWNHYTPANKYYMHSLTNIVPPNEIPCVLVQTSDGRVIYKASAGNLPRTPAELAKAIQDCFHRPRPPAPTPAPVPDVVPQPIPDVGPPMPDVGPGPGPEGPDPLLLGVLAAVATFFVVFAASYVGIIKDKIRAA